MKTLAIVLGVLLLNVAAKAPSVKSAHASESAEGSTSATEQFKGAFKIDQVVEKVAETNNLRESARVWFNSNAELTEALAHYQEISGDFSEVQIANTTAFVWFPNNEAGVFVPYYMKTILGTQNEKTNNGILERINKCHKSGSFHALFPYTYTAAAISTGRHFDVYIGYVGIFCRDQSKIDTIFYTSRFTGNYNGQETDTAVVARAAAAHALNQVQKYLNGNC